MQASGPRHRRVPGLFRQRRAELLARGDPAGYDKRVTTTWALAFAALSRPARRRGCCGCWPAARPRPSRCTCCCARAGRPRDLDAEVAPLLAPLLDDPLARDDAIAALRRYSLISPPRDGLVSVHRLVQAITLTSSPPRWRRPGGRPPLR